MTKQTTIIMTGNLKVNKGTLKRKLMWGIYERNT